MKFIPFLFIGLIISGCSTTNKFPKKNVCFLLFNLETKKFEEIINHDNCEERLPAASTFKVPLAVMALDSNIIKNENSSLAWDGRKRVIESWNKDHSAKTWVRDSVIWYSQKLTERLGKIKTEFYLKKFQFGNADVSGGIKSAWLTPAFFFLEPVENTLKINGYEQVRFLQGLWEERLPASPRSQQITKNLFVNEISSNRVLSGKTGTGFVGKKDDIRLGWYVGYLKTKFNNYVVVINFTDTEKLEAKGFAGSDARELAKKILKEKSLW
jgi:beta-lactamase class D